MPRILIMCFAVLAAPMSAHGVNPGEVLDDPVLEERAREISKGLRCLVCQNQSIDDSDATLAKDLRVLVRDRLAAGDSNEEVLSYVVSRYGDFVLLKPPFKTATLVLWLGPVILILLGILSFVLFFRKNRQSAVAPAPRVQPLSKEEQRKLDKLLKGRDG